MANQSKGSTKRHSELQKAHYKAYRLVNQARKNLIKRLKTRIRRNEAEIKRKGKRAGMKSYLVKIDVGAVNALKRVLNE